MALVLTPGGFMSVRDKTTKEKQKEFVETISRPRSGGGSSSGGVNKPVVKKEVTKEETTEVIKGSADTKRELEDATGQFQQRKISIREKLRSGEITQSQAAFESGEASRRLLDIRKKREVRRSSVSKGIVFVEEDQSIATGQGKLLESENNIQELKSDSFDMKLGGFVNKLIQSTSPSGLITRVSGRNVSEENFFGKGVFMKIEDVRGGFLKGVIPKTKGELIMTGASFGVGASVGAGLKLGGAGLRAVSPTVANVGSKLAIGGGTVLGGTFALGKGKEFLGASTIGKKSEVIGSTARELTSFGFGIKSGTKLAGKSLGYARTIGLKELPAKKIVAPEFYEGQTFPTIKKGQTAGSLLSEFKPMLPGETRPGGFTASAEPLSELTIRRGTSELPGLYQAPKVSPRFLRIQSGENVKTFGLDFLGNRPTIFRVTPTEFELSPFVSKKQSNIASLKQAKPFFETATKGKSIVPFIKTEKEAVIPFDSGLVKTGKRYFIKFSGERIPILEYSTTGKSATQTLGGTNIQKTVSASSLSSSFGGGSSAINPVSLSIFSLTSSKGYKTNRIKSSVPKDLYSRHIPLTSYSPYPSSSKPSKITTKYSGGGYSPIPSFSSSFSSSLRPSKSSSRPSFSGSSILGKPTTNKTGFGIKFPSLGFETKVDLIRPRRKYYRIPSLAAAGLGILESKVRKGEITGIVLRPILKKKRSKK